MRSHWTRADIMKCGGFGDRILATTNDPSDGWYWACLDKVRGYFNHSFRAKVGCCRIHPLLQQLLDKRPVMPQHVLIEPHVKGTFSADNKDWGWERWQALVYALPLPWLQCAPNGARVLDGVKVLRTPTFEHAVAALSLARGIVTTNGGLQYAAAAIGRPAVIVWGSFATARLLGQPGQVNVEEPDDKGLGWRISHPACRAAMRRTSVSRVADAAWSVFGDEASARAGGRA